MMSALVEEEKIKTAKILIKMTRDAFKIVLLR